MLSLILNRADIDKFVTEHSIKQIFIAKDHGAGIGEKANCIFYFKGCDPAKDKDYYDTAVRSSAATISGSISTRPPTHG